jgi:hypothetical protein
MMGLLLGVGPKCHYTAAAAAPMNSQLLQQSLQQPDTDACRRAGLGVLHIEVDRSQDIVLKRVW